MEHNNEKPEEEKFPDHVKLLKPQKGVNITSQAVQALKNNFFIPAIRTLITKKEHHPQGELLCKENKALLKNNQLQQQEALKSTKDKIKDKLNDVTTNDNDKKYNSDTIKQEFQQTCQEIQWKQLFDQNKEIKTNSSKNDAENIFTDELFTSQKLHDRLNNQDEKQRPQQKIAPKARTVQKQNNGVNNSESLIVEEINKKINTNHLQVNPIGALNQPDQIMDSDNPELMYEKIESLVKKQRPQSSSIHSSSSVQNEQIMNNFNTFLGKVKNQKIDKQLLCSSEISFTEPSKNTNKNNSVREDGVSKSQARNLTATLTNPRQKQIKKGNTINADQNHTFLKSFNHYLKQNKFRDELRRPQSHGNPSTQINTCSNEFSVNKPEKANMGIKHIMKQNFFDNHRISLPESLVDGSKIFSLSTKNTISKEIPLMLGKQIPNTTGNKQNLENLLPSRHQSEPLNLFNAPKRPKTTSNVSKRFNNFKSGDTSLPFATDPSQENFLTQLELNIQKRKSLSQPKSKEKEFSKESKDTQKDSKKFKQKQGFIGEINAMNMTQAHKSHTHNQAFDFDLKNTFIGFRNGTHQMIQNSNQVPKQRKETLSMNKRNQVPNNININEKFTFEQIKSSLQMLQPSLQQSKQNHLNTSFKPIVMEKDKQIPLSRNKRANTDYDKANGDLDDAKFRLTLEKAYSKNLNQRLKTFN